MPQDYDKCVREKGRIRTLKLKDGKYIHVCYDKNGKAHSGYVKTKKTE